MGDVELGRCRTCGREHDVDGDEFCGSTGDSIVWNVLESEGRPWAQDGRDAFDLSTVISVNCENSECDDPDGSVQVVLVGSGYVDVAGAIPRELDGEYYLTTAGSADDETILKIGSEELEEFHFQALLEQQRFEEEQFFAEEKEVNERRTRLERFTGYFVSGKNDLRQMICDIVGAAAKRITLFMYTFTDANIRAAIVDAAARGVVVDVYIDAGQWKKARGMFDVVRRLVRAGVSVFAVTASQEYGSMHLKSMHVDNLLHLSGSFNFTWTAGARSVEDFTVYVGNDAVDRMIANAAGVQTRATVTKLDL